MAGMSKLASSYAKRELPPLINDIDTPLARYIIVTPLVHINPRFIVPALLFLGVN